MKSLAGPLLVLVISSLGLAPLSPGAETSARDRRSDSLRAGGDGLTTVEEERDAREIAERINEALNLRREVLITLHNDTAINVAGRVSIQRYWLVITGHDGSEIRFRAAMIATVRIK